MSIIFSFILQNVSHRNFSDLVELFGQNLDETNNKIKQKYLPNEVNVGFA